MPQSVYIAHGGPDEQFAKLISDTLKTQGIQAFLFKDDATPGQKLHRMMRKGINEFDRVLLICSRNSLDRSGVQNEIEETLQREAREGGSERLIPITLDDYVLRDWDPSSGDLAQAIRDRVVADFKNADSDSGKFEIAFARLMNALGGSDDVRYVSFRSYLELLDDQGKNARWVVERTIKPLRAGITELVPREILGPGNVRLAEVNYGEMVPVQVGGVTMYKAMFPSALPQGDLFVHRLVIEEEDCFLSDEEDFVFRDQSHFSKLDFHVTLPITRAAISARATKTLRSHEQNASVFSLSPDRTTMHLKVATPEIGASYRISWKW